MNTPDQQYIMMNINYFMYNGLSMAEVVSDELLIRETQDALDLMADISCQGVMKIIVYAKNLTPEFFNLKSKLAGEVLQKFSNYRVQLAIVGDFSRYESKSLRDFIYESNKFRQINFVSSLEEAIERLAN